MAITVSVLGSGSRGNATFIKTDGVRLLIDAGISRKELARRLEVQDIVLIANKVPQGMDRELLKGQIEAAYRVPVVAMLPLGRPQREVTKLRRAPVESFTTVGTFDGPAFTG